MKSTDREALLREIGNTDGNQTNASHLAKLMQEWLKCANTQDASNALARALSLQGKGDPVFPQAGVWPIPLP